MGWTSTHKNKGESLTEFFKTRGPLSWGPDCPATYEVLDSAFINLSEYYAAVKRTDKATGAVEVWAAVFMVKMFKPDKYGHNICYKDMTEHMGPYQTRCPERILDLLTPTDSEYAKAWRIACREYHAAKKTRLEVVEGRKIKYGNDTFIAMESLGARGWRVKAVDTGTTYRMNRSQIAKAEIFN